MAVEHSVRIWPDWTTIHISMLVSGGNDLRRIPLVSRWIICCQVLATLSMFLRISLGLSEVNPQPTSRKVVGCILEKSHELETSHQLQHEIDGESLIKQWVEQIPKIGDFCGLFVGKNNIFRKEMILFFKNIYINHL